MEPKLNMKITNEIRITEPMAKNIIANYINGIFGTKFFPSDVIVMYTGEFEDIEFDGFAITTEKTVEASVERG